MTGDIESIAGGLADIGTGAAVAGAIERERGGGDGHTHEGACLNCGAELVGPLPAEVQSMSLLCACGFAATPQPEAARALIRFLATPEAARVMAARGLEPVGRSTD